MQNETRFCTLFPCSVYFFFDFQTQKKAVLFMVTVFNNVEISMNASCMLEIIGNCPCYLICQGTERLISSLES